MKRVLCVALLGAAASVAWGQVSSAPAGSAPKDNSNATDAQPLQQIEIIGTTPLSGAGVSLRKTPANVQVFTGREMSQQRSSSVADFLNSNAGSVNLLAAQGNPNQPDLNFRGFSASPLLGTPQGLSVYLDGVRLNETLGDVVNWDLLPTSAIARVQLMPPSNPAFGLNSLGGALAMSTKSGHSEYPDAPGGSVSASAGSFGRRTLELDAGGRHGPWDWFVTGHAANDAGWAEHNPSHMRQLFAKAGWHADGTEVNLSLVAANNRLGGTQTLPLSWSDNIRQAYTFPDENRNRATLWTLHGSHLLSADWLMTGNAYARRFVNRNLSSNANDHQDDGDDDDDEEEAQATNEKSSITQKQAGLGLQLVHNARWGTRGNEMSHRLAFGLGVDDGRAAYALASQPGAFTPERGATPVGEFEPVTDADTRTRLWGAYVSDTVELSPEWTLTLAARLNQAEVRISDRTGLQPELNGDHRFRATRPAMGLSFSPSAALTLHGHLSQGMRTPSALELTCADPETPCRLPNSFLSDPPLKPVLSTTAEAGARGKLGTLHSWHVAVFRTDLRDDLQFVSSGGVARNAGYFRNVGTTRRQGLELGARTRWGQERPLSVMLDYSFIDATFRSDFKISSAGHSQANSQGDIDVRSGNRLPNVARHTLKLRADWAFVPQLPVWRMVGQLHVNSGVFARGDESNNDQQGAVPGGGLFNLQLHGGWGGAALDRWQFFARIDNVFNRRQPSFGVIGANAFTGPGKSFDPTHARSEQFRGYAAPRALVLGVQTSWGGSAN
jgi:iron complex outermembrane recepter protein